MKCSKKLQHTACSGKFCSRLPRKKPHLQVLPRLVVEVLQVVALTWTRPSCFRKVQALFLRLLRISTLRGNQATIHHLLLRSPRKTTRSFRYRRTSPSDARDRSRRPKDQNRCRHPSSGRSRRPTQVRPSTLRHANRVQFHHRLTMAESIRRCRGTANRVQCDHSEAHTITMAESANKRKRRCCESQTQSSTMMMKTNRLWLKPFLIRHSTSRSSWSKLPVDSKSLCRRCKLQVPQVLCPMSHSLLLLPMQLVVQSPYPETNWMSPKPLVHFPPQRKKEAMFLPPMTVTVTPVVLAATAPPHAPRSTPSATVASTSP